MPAEADPSSAEAARIELVFMMPNGWLDNEWNEGQENAALMCGVRCMLYGVWSMEYGLWVMGSLIDAGCDGGCVRRFSPWCWLS
jgi:hypothetical protein